MATLTERAQEIAAAQESRRQAELASKIAARKREAITHLNNFLEIEFTNDMLRTEAHGYSEPIFYFELEGWEFRWSKEFLNGSVQPTLRVKNHGGWSVIHSLANLAKIPKTIGPESTRISRLFARLRGNKS